MIRNQGCGKLAGTDAIRGLWSMTYGVRDREEDTLSHFFEKMKM